MHPHAMDRMRAPGRDAAFPVGDADAATRAAACEPVARAVGWAGVIPFSAAIAHPASMAGFNVSPSVTATVCSRALRRCSRKATAAGLPRSSLGGTTHLGCPAWAGGRCEERRARGQQERQDFARGVRGQGSRLDRAARIGNAQLFVWVTNRRDQTAPFLTVRWAAGTSTRAVAPVLRIRVQRWCPDNHRDIGRPMPGVTSERVPDNQLHPPRALYGRPANPPGMEIADFFHLPAWHYEREAV